MLNIFPNTQISQIRRDVFPTYVSVRVANVHFNTMAEHCNRESVVPFQPECLRGENIIPIWVQVGAFRAIPQPASEWVRKPMQAKLEGTIPCESSRWRFRSRPWGCARIRWQSRWRRVEGWEPEPGGGTPALGRTFYSHKCNGAKRTSHDDALRNMRA